MKDLIKTVFPEPIKKILRKAEDVLARLKYGFTKPLILEDKYGTRFVLYPATTTPIRWLFERGAYEKEARAIQKLVRPGDVAFDVGANVGTITAILAKLVGEDGKVFSFEPFPSSLRRLKETIALNDLKQVDANGLAIADKDGSARFYIEEANPELNSLGKVDTGEHRLSSHVDVDTRTLDSFCREKRVESIDFLKIDVEGFEIDALRGASSLLDRKAVRAIQFEVSPTPLQSLGRKPTEIVDFLQRRGYNVYEFDTKTDTFVGPMTELPETYDNYYASFENLAK